MECVENLEIFLEARAGKCRGLGVFLGTRGAGQEGNLVGYSSRRDQEREFTCNCRPRNRTSHLA